MHLIVFHPIVTGLTERISIERCKRIQYRIGLINDDGRVGMSFHKRHTRLARNVGTLGYIKYL